MVPRIRAAVKARHTLLAEGTKVAPALVRSVDAVDTGNLETLLKSQDLLTLPFVGRANAKVGVRRIFGGTVDSCDDSTCAFDCPLEAGDTTGLGSIVASSLSERREQQT
jgi:hypothetical protein